MSADSATTIVVEWGGVVSLALLILIPIAGQCASLIEAVRKVSDTWRGDEPPRDEGDGEQGGSERGPDR